MKRFDSFFTRALIAVFCSALAYADSSGNFTATGTSAACTATPATFNVATGGFGGQTLSGGTTATSFSTAIQTPSGQGTTLVIRPSMTTGLFTSTKLTTTINNATADVGISVCVNVDATPAHPAGIPVSPSNCVVYDQRIQQVSNTLFGNLATCIPPPASGACTTDGDCASGSTCTNPSGGSGAGLCQAPAPGCSFELLQTTLSAHSFDFVVPVSNGTHNVVLTWGLIGSNSTNGSTDACVGPISLTVQQVKNFKNSQTISFTTN
ncbi:MAG: hypothetical protein DMG59_22735 [Acidobacteria bacterium]|nr:MAG: hypothetical protein DMG59_22735 [Acidobacteriota bacterium]